MKKNNNSGLCFFELLGIVFIVLKLMKVIDWSWLWVLAPLWLPLVLLIIIVAVWAFINTIKRKSHGKDKGCNEN